jgi:predicted Fe-Mo cluster-binding NifX family protein
MNVCLPVNADSGLQSPLCGHFGAAPFFLVVDTETLACRALPNHNAHHEHGKCSPLAALEGQSIDAMVVGGIGPGAIARLQAAGIRVFHSQHATVEQAIASLKAKTLVEVDASMACQHHGGGHG